MDDITVENEDDDFLHSEQFAESMKVPNFSPEPNYFYEALNFMYQYAWFIAVGIGILAFIYFKYVKERLEKFKKHRTEKKYQNLYTEEVAFKRQEAMEEARRRLQEKHNQHTQKWIEEKKQKEEEKRLERLKDWERHQQGLGYRSKEKFHEEDTQPNSEKKPLSKPTKKLRQPDYNPLVGDNSTPRYVPSRNCSSQGGG